MAGTERDGPVDTNSGPFDDSGEETDDSDRNPDDSGLIASITSVFDRDDRDVEADDEAVADAIADADEDGAGLLERVKGLVEDVDEDENVAPSQAELVDGAQVLFIDPAARSKELYEYDLVLITASQYPEPVVLKNDAPIEVPEGSVLCSSTEATMIDYAGKRVIARSYILVPPSRADEVSPDYREDVPEAIVGKTIPRREVQNEQFYNLILNGAEASK